MGFYRREYNGRLEEQKRDLEIEQQRRQQEDREHRSNVNRNVSSSTESPIPLF